MITSGLMISKKQIAQTDVYVFFTSSHMASTIVPNLELDS
jgi:hypothetical protein